ncbi:hypothetical protein DHEL01_v206261 [Diaporthe helianthi]|uniref:Uncharacterized protein n=1 Tax=Diaporthe helianthi TaxID=158607 RepID=A0A2P5HYN9_DIAHE|nr:hypothetical protein DHEL01_v206261 [Diaporthe helianthi]
MIGAGTTSSSAFAVLGGRQDCTQPLGVLAPRPMCFLGGIKRTISRVFPRPEPIIAATQRLCDGRRLKALVISQFSSPLTPPRRQSARGPTRRVTATANESLRVVGPTDVPASRHTASRSHEAVTASCMLPDSPRTAESLSRGSDAIANKDNLPLDVRRKPTPPQQRRYRCPTRERATGQPPPTCSSSGSSPSVLVIGPTAPLA